MLKLLRFVLFLAMMAGLCIAGAAAFAWWWLAQPLPLRAPAVELKVAAGATPRDIARGWVAAGVDTSPLLLYEWIRWSGEARKIRAGTYEIKQGATPRDLLAVMLRGGDQMVGVRFIEGWTFKQMRAELARIDGIKNESAGMNDAQIMQASRPKGASFPTLTCSPRARAIWPCSSVRTRRCKNGSTKPGPSARATRRSRTRSRC
jgi:UPF0755 protein